MRTNSGAAALLSRPPCRGMKNSSEPTSLSCRLALRRAPIQLTHSPACPPRPFPPPQTAPAPSIQAGLCGERRVLQPEDERAHGRPGRAAEVAGSLPAVRPLRCSSSTLRAGGKRLPTAAGAPRGGGGQPARSPSLLQEGEADGPLQLPARKPPPASSPGTCSRGGGAEPCAGQNGSSPSLPLRAKLHGA